MPERLHKIRVGFQSSFTELLRRRLFNLLQGYDKFGATLKTNLKLNNFNTGIAHKSTYLEMSI